MIQYENKLRLLEIAQVPPEHVDDFKSVKTFKFFNTNNIWAKLSSIERVLREGRLNMEIIVNPKTLEGGLRVVQLETAVGAAMKCFEGAIGESSIQKILRNFSEIFSCEFQASMYHVIVSYLSKNALTFYLSCRICTVFKTDHLSCHHNACSPQHLSSNWAKIILAK